MSNIQISALGVAFLANQRAASAVAVAIAEKKHDLLSEKGLVVKAGLQSFTVRSAAFAAGLDITMITDDLACDHSAAATLP